MDGLYKFDSGLAEAIFSFAEVCRVRRFSPEPLIVADLSIFPGVYKDVIGLSWAFRIQPTGKLMAVTEEGVLYWATRTWKLRNKSSWLRDVVGDYFLIAESELHADESLQLRDTIMSGLLLSLESAEISNEVQPVHRQSP